MSINSSFSKIDRYLGSSFNKPFDKKAIRDGVETASTQLDNFMKNWKLNPEIKIKQPTLLNDKFEFKSKDQDNSFLHTVPLVTEPSDTLPPTILSADTTTSSKKRSRSKSLRERPPMPHNMKIDYSRLQPKLQDPYDLKFRKMLIELDMEKNKPIDTPEIKIQASKKLTSSPNRENTSNKGDNKQLEVPIQDLTLNVRRPPEEKKLNRLRSKSI